MRLPRLARSLALLLSLAAAGQVFAATLTGRVIGIQDGDTVTILTIGHSQERIRLAGIDAPEKGMPFGQKSRAHLAAAIAQREATVEYTKRDRYGRIVGKVLVDGTDVSLAQVQAGLAWHYKQYEKEQTPEDRIRYAEAEREARASQRGLWADAQPTPPWEWRHPPRNLTSPRQPPAHTE